MHLCATAFIFFGFLGPSLPHGASGVPVADNHSGAGLEALERWDMEKCRACLATLTHTHNLVLLSNNNSVVLCNNFLQSPTLG